MKIKIFLTIFTVIFFSSITYAFETLSAQGGGAESTFEWAPSKFPIKYAIHTNGTADIPGTNERNQLKLALNRWNPLTPFKFQFSGLTNTVSQGDLLNGIIFDKQNFDLGSSVLAFCEGLFFVSDPKTRVEGDIHFNNQNFKWTMGASNPNNKLYKILPVAVHELGHSVGLGHTAVPEGTMFFSAQAGDIGETLHPDDIAGTKFLYNARQNTLAVPKLITPLDNTQHRVLVGTGTQAAAGITFRWEQNTTLNLTNFVLEFAGNATFTQGFRKFVAGTKLALLMGPGARLNALKNIQKTSALTKVFWRVSAKTSSGATVRSAVQSFQLVQ